METNQPDPRMPPSSTNPFAAPMQTTPSPSAVTDEYIKAEAERLMKQKLSTTTAWQLFATGIIGCFSPILAIYGTVFLLRRPEPFPLKGLAIAGVVLHWIWTLVWVAIIIGGRM